MTINPSILQDLYVKKFDRDKQISTAITILLLLIFYAILNVTQVPTHRRYKDDSNTKDVLIAKYRAQRHIDIPATRPSPVEKPRTESRVTASVPLEKTKKIDMKKIMAEMEVLIADPVSQPLHEISKKEKSASSESKLQIDQNDVSDLFLSMTTDNADMGASSMLKHVPNSSHLRTSLTTLETNSNTVPAKKNDYLNSNFDTSVIEDKGKTSEVTEVNLIELPDDIKTKMPVIFVKIAQWMKENPVPLPNAFKKFMGYKKNHLTSKVEFQIGDRFFEIYLLCIENTYEIKICLIEGNHTTLLIDEGFTHESHYLRTGTVFRSGKTREVLSFGTKQKPASKQATREFYQIFLSWWKTTGMDKL